MLRLPGLRLMAGLTAAGFATMAGVAGANAQKSADTLRVAYQEPIATVEVIQDPKPDTIITNNAVFDGLLWYDPASLEYKGVLAESWTQIDDKTLEFKLRRGVKFHDGSPFTADDVVYTFSWMMDPSSKLRFFNLEFLERVEKVDDFTVRLINKRVTSHALSRLDSSNPIYPKAIHGALADKTEFGRKRPIGTGPYRVESIEAGKGVVLVRNDDYNHAQPWRPKGKIKRIVISTIPDMQTQVAQILTGGLDLVRDVPGDVADSLGKNPSLKISGTESPNYLYMMFDATNRAGNEALAKYDVRRALEMAVNRKLLAQTVVPGGALVKVLDVLCVQSQIDCPRNPAVKPPEYNAAAAKKLLADAGYPDGFKVEITTFPGAQTVAEAVAGEFRKIGVAASVDFKSFGPYREKSNAGKIQILVGHFWSAGGTPIGTLDAFFGPEQRDYSRDPEIASWKAKAIAATDQATRVAAYKKIFEIVNEKAYFLPLTSDPTIFASTKDVTVEPGALNPGGIDLNRIHWN